MLYKATLNITFPFEHVDNAFALHIYRETLHWAQLQLPEGARVYKETDVHLYLGIIDEILQSAGHFNVEGLHYPTISIHKGGKEIIPEEEWTIHITNPKVYLMAPNRTKIPVQGYIDSVSSLHMAVALNELTVSIEGDLFYEIIPPYDMTRVAHLLEEHEHGANIDAY